MTHHPPDADAQERESTQDYLVRILKRDRVVLGTLLVWGGPGFLGVILALWTGAYSMSVVVAAMFIGGIMSLILYAIMDDWATTRRRKQRARGGSDGSKRRATPARRERGTRGR